MEIVDFLPIYPLVNDENFYKEIFKKKELYMLRLDETEEKPEEPGDLLRHQIFMSRFMSPYTPYTKLLAIHGLGSGKTCMAVAVAEHLKTVSINPRKCLVLVKGPLIKENFKNELADRCTSGKYIPLDYTTTRLNSLIREYYEINTFGTFVKTIKSHTDEVIKRNYADRLIIIDEAHNLHIQPEEKIKNKKEKVDIYKQLHRFLHLVGDARILLLTATPMINDSSEVASLMNLILPLDQQLDKKTFNETFLSEDKEKVLNLPELKRAFRGKISYVRSMASNSIKLDQGQIVKPLHHLQVVPAGMSKHQYAVYKEAEKKDKKRNSKIGSAFALQSRQSSNYVFEDGSYGTDAVKKHIKVIKKGQLGKIKIKKKSSKISYVLDSATKKLFEGKSIKEKLKVLSKYSQKFVNIITSILDNPDELTFVFCEFTGYGAILFTEILKLFGFGEAIGGEVKKGKKGKRFGLITGETAKNRINTLIETYNSPKNSRGDYIQVIVGSKILGEGSSLFNTRQCHIMYPHWNNSSTEQAIGRVFRAFSHAALPPDNRYVKVYRHASVIVKKGVIQKRITADIRLYKLSEDKDLAIRRIERIMKKSAIDCAFNYTRNVVQNDIDGSRKCDYQKCEYFCQDIPKKWKDGLRYKYYDEKKLIRDTYNLYYSGNEIKEIVLEIKKLFREFFVLSLPEIFHRLNCDHYLVLRALEYIIEEMIEMRDRYGFLAYLKERYNVYFLVRSSVDDSDPLMIYYSKYPTIDISYNFDVYMDLLRLENDRLTIIKIQELDPNKNKGKIRRYLNKLQPQIKEMILEFAVLYNRDNLGSINEKKKQKIIINYFKSYLFDIDGMKVSFILGKELLRCLPKDQDQWTVCIDPGLVKKVEDKEKLAVGDIETNEYKMYATVERATNKFRIRDLTQKRTSNKGKDCNSYTKPHLVKMILKTDVEVENIIDENNKGRLIQSIVQQNVGEIYTKKQLKKMNIEQLKILLTWLNMTIQDLCATLREFFKENNLIIYI
jgi:superfamily II DNA or RNA helicase